MRQLKPEEMKFTLENMADLICEYIHDGKRKTGRDVVKWFRWLEKKCGRKESYIYTRGSNKL
jgi:hypothetical protein